MCILEKRIADWDTNCGTKSRGLGRAADGVRVRAGKKFREEKARRIGFLFCLNLFQVPIDAVIVDLKLVAKLVSGE